MASHSFYDVLVNIFPKTGVLVKPKGSYLPSYQCISMCLTMCSPQGATLGFSVLCPAPFSLCLRSLIATAVQQLWRVDKAHSTGIVLASEVPNSRRAQTGPSKTTGGPLACVDLEMQLGSWELKVRCFCHCRNISVSDRSWKQSSAFLGLTLMIPVQIGILAFLRREG